MNQRLFTVALIATLLTPTLSLAGKVVIPAVEDAYVSSEYPDVNYGASTVLKVKMDFNMPQSDVERTFVKFDLSMIPPDATINVAYLYMSDPSTGVNFDVSIYKSHVEHHITWNNQPSYDGVLLDRIPLYPDPGWYYGDVTSTVQQWYAGTSLNNGVVLTKSFVGGGVGIARF